MKYAILFLNTMTVRKFISKDEFKEALSDSITLGKEVHAYKYHESVGMWTESEIAR